MKNNLKKLCNRYNFKQNIKIKTLKKNNKIYHEKIDSIINEKKFENDKKNLENDIIYIKKILKKLVEENLFFKNEKDKFFTDEFNTLEIKKRIYK